MTKKTVSHYEILDKLGSGGMGVVYRARDLKLDRTVALKFLSPELSLSEEERKRFVREAKAASSLDHPNIGVVFDIDETPDGQTFIAMAYYPGETLQRKIASGLPVDQSLGIALQIAHGLAKAHAQGIIHRDIKPSNVIVTDDEVAKIIDFGLAAVSDATVTIATAKGTPAYMSPEQATGQPTDARTDVWALGAMLYEMLSGRRPFPGEHATAILFEVVHHEPMRLREIKPEIDPELERIVLKALEKKPDTRYSSAAEMARDLATLRTGLSAPTLTTMQPLSIPTRGNRRAWIAAGLALVAVGAAAYFGFSKVQRDRQQAASEVARLIRQNELTSAFLHAKKTGATMTDDQWRAMSSVVSIETTPPGADIHWKNYSTPDAEWQSLGRTPLAKIRIPLGALRVRVTKPGFEVHEGVLAQWNNDMHDQAFGPNWTHGDQIRFTLSREGSLPAGMVAAPPGQISLRGPYSMEGFLIDKHEVTNRQFKEFVLKGGYQDRAWWKHRFLRDRKELSFEEAMSLFRDATGRPGPSTWEGGTFSAGQEEYPVRGVSWYEAAAYAEFAGKSLPTMYHWNRAAAPLLLSPVLVPLSNFGGHGPAPAGRHQGLSPFGTFDMAGNVKEWCWNESQDANRYTLGGAWNEERFSFGELDQRPPLDRSSNQGFRCVRYSGPVDDKLTAPRPFTYRDYGKEKPVPDETFNIYRSMYIYERTGLDAKVESIDDSTEGWRKEKVSFRAAYGNERMNAYLFLPKSATPPYQAVVFMPWASATFTESSANLVCMEFLEFVIKSGRAVIYPVFQGTYERRIPPVTSAVAGRDLAIMMVKDLARSIDYIETRSDLRKDKLGFYGASMGATFGWSLALEDRVKTAVLVDGAFPSGQRRPEADPINFAPRVKIPVLMINGRYDNVFPVEKLQLPMFRAFGTPEKDKRHVVLDTTHYALVARTEVVREVLGWLDKYLGPVQ